MRGHHKRSESLYFAGLRVSIESPLCFGPPQHAWAASLLGACKLQQIRSRRSCSSSESSNSDSDSAGGGVLTGCENEDEETFRDWGTPYEDVERLLGAPARGVTPGALKATGRSCRWCSRPQQEKGE